MSVAFARGSRRASHKTAGAVARRLSAVESVTQSYLLVGFVTASAGLLFLWTDPRSETSRAQALCLVLIGLRLLIVPFEGDLGAWWGAVGGGFIEVLSILAGIEWARRVGMTATERLRAPVHWLFRVSQLLVLIYGAMQLGYLLIAPEAAVRSADGLIDVRGIEWALFAPVLGTAMLVSGIAIVLLLFLRTDPAESIRLRALVLATPFLLAGLVVGRAWVPIVLVIGLMIFMAGTVRYLLVQARRAQSMSQFLSPEVARLIKLRGVEQVLRQDKRRISVVVCDLRQFTAYAREHDSATVVKLLERYYAVVGEVALRHGGTVKDHAGDGVVILVGAPVHSADHAVRAAQLALDLVARVQALLADVDAALGIGAGVASGEVTVGAIHGSGRLEYVAVGTPVNLAARLCQRAAPGEVLADEAVGQAVADVLVAAPRTAEPFKGFDGPVAVCALSEA